MMTPKEFLKFYVEKFNAKNVSSLIDMYEVTPAFKFNLDKLLKV